MKIQITCPECGSGIHVYPKRDANSVECGICQHVLSVKFSQDHEDGILKECPVCERKDFYQQKDFNRKIGVILFVIAALFVPWTYGLSLLLAYLIDVFLFRRLGSVSSCYKCQTLFRDISNLDDIYPYDHEMNDRIVYSDHDFEGQAPHGH